MVPAPPSRRPAATASPTRERLETVDILRGLAIAVVVAFHSRNYSLVLPAAPGTPTTLAWATLTEIFLVPVPVFVILSGLVLAGRPGAAEGRAGFARRRLRRLLVPLAAWSLVGLVVSVTLQARTGPSGVYDWLSSIALGTRWYPLYFLVVAIQLSVLVATLPRGRGDRDRAALGLLAVQLVAVGALQVVVHLRPDQLAPVSAQAAYLAVSWTGYFGLGLLAAPRLDRLRAAPPPLRLLTGAVALGMLAWLVAIARDGGALSYYQSPLHMALATSLALLGLWTLPALPAVLRRGLAGLGAASFGVYLAHGLVLPLVAWIAGPGWQLQPATGTAWLRWLTIAAATLAGSLLLQRLLARFAAGRALLGDPGGGSPGGGGDRRREPGGGARAEEAYTAGAA